MGREEDGLARRIFMGDDGIQWGFVDTSYGGCIGRLYHAILRWAL